ncbi:MAG TPA: ribonuclease Z [Marmoricola sp.]|jgi:ribonuclease Z|nr:ribonuclease Z [Marmoricola sp.]
MGGREFVALGTSSMVPTRTRAHQGSVLRWDDELVLFDPGEGTQRQLTLAGVPAGRITRICITHLHGDHCLGLPGVLARMQLDGAPGVDLYYPASGAEYVARLRRATAGEHHLDVREHPVDEDGLVDRWPGLELHAAALDHRVDTYGWRLQEPDGRRMVPHLLERAGLTGPAISRLQERGELVVDGRTVRLEDVSEPRRGQAFAFVMDTRFCAAAVTLARDVDLLVTECTYLADEARLAEKWAHLTTTDAARIATEARARRLVLTHYSQRHLDEAEFAREAQRHFPDVHAARDLDRIAVPRRS